MNIIDNSPYSGRDLPFPLSAAVSLLTAHHDSTWGAFALGGKAALYRLPQTEALKMADEAFLCGQREAERVVAETGTQDPKSLCRIWNLTLRQVADLPFGAAMDFARYVPPDKIMIYTEAISLADGMILENGLADTLCHADLYGLLLAHELFHYREFMDPCIYTRAAKITLWSVGPIRYKTPVNALSEIGAMAFAKTLCKLPYSPYVLTFVMMYPSAPEKAIRYYQDFIAFAESL